MDPFAWWSRRLRGDSVEVELLGDEPVCVSCQVHAVAPQIAPHGQVIGQAPAATTAEEKLSNASSPAAASSVRVASMSRLVESGLLGLSVLLTEEIFSLGRIGLLIAG